MKKLISYFLLFTFAFLLFACTTTKEIQTTPVTLLSWKFHDQKAAWVTVLKGTDTLTVFYSWYGHSPKFVKGMCLLLKK